MPTQAKGVREAPLEALEVEEAAGLVLLVMEDLSAAQADSQDKEFRNLELCNPQSERKLILAQY